MRKITFLFTATAFAISAVAPAFAASTYDDGTSMPMSSTANRDDMEGGRLKDEGFSLRPAAGVLAFVSPTGDTEARGALALLTDINLSRILPEPMRVAHFGVSSGVIYSHVGSPSSNFFGTNPDTMQTTTGANVVLIPANVKVGLNVAENARLAIHGGGNVIYRSQAAALDMGSSSSAAGDVWRIFPNVGADFDVGIARNVSLAIRPDWTFTPGQDLFTGTIGLGVNLG